MFFSRSFKRIAAVGSKEEMSHESVTLSDVHTFHSPLNKHPHGEVWTQNCIRRKEFDPHDHTLRLLSPTQNLIRTTFYDLGRLYRLYMNYIMTILPPRLTAPAILDRIKWNSKLPSPQIKDEAGQKPKRANFPSLIGGGRGRGYKFSIFFVQDCGPLSHAWTCPHQPHGAIASNTRTSSPPPTPGWETMEFLRGKLLKLRISLGVE